MSNPIFVFKLSCQDRPGIVAAVSSCIAEHGGNILESAQFDDLDTGDFFMRVRFSCQTDQGRDRWEHAFKPVIDRFGMRHELIDESHRQRVVIMVSKIDHCLNDLLYRWRRGRLAMDIVAVVSNHDVLRSEVEALGIPYHHWPVTPETKAEQEAKLLALIDAEQVDLVVLARYMQVLSNSLSRKLYGRVINIHHSFLPGFKGAKPYHQAHARGVKLIGATAHFVTEDLDEGPIIAQDVAVVDHSFSVRRMVDAGGDVEARVLARAVRYHLQNRILLNGNKTVVFT